MVIMNVKLTKNHITTVAQTDEQQYRQTQVLLFVPYEKFDNFNLLHPGYKAFAELIQARKSI